MLNAISHAVRRITVVRVVRTLIALVAVIGGAAAPPVVNAAPSLAPLAIAAPGKGATGRYIVVMQSGRVRGAGALRAKADALQTRGGERVTQVYGGVVNGFAVDLTDAAVTQLRSDPAVAWIEQDQVMRAIDVQSNPPWAVTVTT